MIDALFAISLWPEGVTALANLDLFEELQRLDYDHFTLQELRRNIARYKARRNQDSKTGYRVERVYPTLPGPPTLPLP
jgi:hypothetical protein